MSIDHEISDIALLQQNLKKRPKSHEDESVNINQITQAGLTLSAILFLFSVLKLNIAPPCGDIMVPGEEWAPSSGVL